MDFNSFMKVLRNSKRYEMNCEGKLTISDYYTGEEITLDLTKLSEEDFEDMVVYDEEEYEEDYE